MEIEKYRQRLIEFNSTEKYSSEMNFMKMLIGWVEKSKIIDYGCGIGTLVEDLQIYASPVHGHDKINYTENKNWFVENPFDNWRWNVVCFMHSIAHIDKIENILSQIKATGSEVCVITPNKNYIDMLPKNENYVPDETVVKHYTSETLKELFEGCNFDIINAGSFGDLHSGQHERLFLKAK